MFTISDHFKKLQTILTDEQKEILYQEHQKRVAEKMAKIKEIQKNKPKCECKEIIMIFDKLFKKEKKTPKLLHFQKNAVILQKK